MKRVATRATKRQTPMWTGHRSENGTWHWFYPLPNGWNAVVRDDSQSYEPARPTRYEVSAVTPGMLHVAGTDSFESFEEAKRQALNLAMAQPDVTRRRPGLRRIPRETEKDEFEP